MWLLGSPGSLLRFWVTLHVLRLGSADLRVVGPGHALRVTVGQDVVLPCHLSPATDARSWDIRWIRHDVTETVHHYRHGEDVAEDQMEEYAGRTELVRDGLSSGSLDLRISRLRPTDDGQYVCTVTDGASYGEDSVDLEVAGSSPATGSGPQLSLEGYEAGGIRVLCRSAGGFPQPEVLWKDPDGHRVPSVSQRRSPDARGLFDIEDVIVVTGTGEGNWSCVVRNRRLDQEQEASLRISAPFFHDARRWITCLVVVIVLSLGLLGLAAYLWRRKVLLSRELGKRDAALEAKDAALKEQEAVLRDQATAQEEQAAALLKREAELAWRRFLLPHAPDVVTLDPSTAHPSLVLSQDGRSVRCGSKWQALPDSDQRFTHWPCVLGREGFKEGRHCWEVEVKEKVGGDSWWALGVARDSVAKNCYMEVSPKEGIWGVMRLQGQFCTTTCPLTTLSWAFSRVWVCLDCSQEQVTFIDGHSGATIFAFPPASFNGEPIRPWLAVFKEETELCLRDSTPCPPSIPPPAPQRPCPPPDPAHTPLLADPGADVPLCPASAHCAPAEQDGPQ